jgi:hypothetical protein
MVFVKRRDFIRLGAVGSASLIVPSVAWAMPGGPPAGPPEQLLTLLGLAFDYFIAPQIGLTPDEGATIWGLFEAACKAVGRPYSTHSTTRAAGGASVPVSVHLSSASSGIAIHGSMSDGGKTAFTHDGAAPSHTHPMMKAHAAAIVGKAHGYLKGTNR